MNFIMAEEFKIIAKIVTDDKQAKVKAQTTGKEIAKSVDNGTKNVKAGENINKSLDKVKKNSFGDAIKGQLQNVKRGIQAIGVGGDRLTKIGDFFQGGAIAAFAAVAMAAGAALVKMWEDATESAEEYYDRMQKNQQFLNKAIEKSQTENQATNEWFQRLHEINKLEKIGNAQKAEAAILIENLIRKYGQLGITVDGTTGRYQNLYQAQLKVLDLQYQGELRLRQQKRDLYTGRGGTAHVATASVMDEIGTGYKMRTEERYDQHGTHLSTDTIETVDLIDLSRYGSLEDALNMGLDIRLLQQAEENRTGVRVRRGKVVNETTTRRYETQQTRMNRRWNEGGFQGKLQWIRYMRNHPSYRGNSDFIELLNNLEKQILEAMIASDEYSAYRATGKPSDQKALQDMAAQNRKIEAQQAKGEETVKQNAERRRIQQQQVEYQALDSQGKIDWQTRKNNEAKAEITRATAEVAKLEAQYKKSDEKLAETIKSGDKNKIEIAQKQHLELLQRLNTEKQKLQDARNTEQSSRIEIEKLEQLLKKQQEKSKKYYEDKKADDEFQLKYQKLILQGKFQEAEQLKIINDLKKQGLQIDEKAVKDMVQRNRELFNIQKQKSLVDMGQGLISQHGTSQEKLLQEYKKLTEGITDKDLKADYWKLLKLREGLTNLPDVESYQMQSNELTKRGGFRTGIVDNADRITRQIANNTKQTNDYLQQIKQITQKNGNY